MLQVKMAEQPELKQANEHAATQQHTHVSNLHSVGGPSSLIAALASQATTIVTPFPMTSAVTSSSVPTVQMHHELATLNERIKELEEQLKEAQEKVAILSKDNMILGEQLIDAREKQSEHQHANELLTLEMHELTEKLFQEANILVSAESRRRHEAEVAKERVEQQLQQTQILLQSEVEQVQELQLKLEAFCAGTDMLAEEKIISYDESAPTLPLSSDSIPQPEPRLYGEFVQFVQQIALLKAIKVSQMPFLRRCIEEDIEPTLLSFKKFSLKKIVDAYLENRLFLEAVSESELGKHSVDLLVSPSSSGSFSNLQLDRMNDANICSACEHACDTFLFRFKLDESSGWKTIDGHCRNRLAAVGEFFSFIRHCKLGLYQKHTTIELYYECSRLRRQMLYVRLGFPLVPMVDSTVGDGRTRFSAAFLQPHSVQQAVLQKQTSLLLDRSKMPPPPLITSMSSPALVSPSSKGSFKFSMSNMLRRGSQQPKDDKKRYSLESYSTLHERHAPSDTLGVGNDQITSSPSTSSDPSESTSAPTDLSN